MEDKNIKFIIDEVKIVKPDQSIKESVWHGEHEERDRQGETIVVTIPEDLTGVIRYTIEKGKPRKKGRGIGIPWQHDVEIAFDTPQPGMTSINGTVIDLSPQQLRDILKKARAGDAAANEFLDQILVMILGIGFKPLADEVRAIYDDPLVQPAFDKLKGLFHSENITDRVNAKLFIDPDKPTLNFLREFKEKARPKMIQELAKDSQNFLSDERQGGMTEPEKPKQVGRYRLTAQEIKFRRQKVKEAEKIKKDNPQKQWKEIDKGFAEELNISDRTFRSWRHNNY